MAELNISKFFIIILIKTNIIKKRFMLIFKVMQFGINFSVISHTERDKQK